MFRKSQNIHFVGIGGIGMSGIAEVLLNMSHHVSGSDLRRSLVTERLERLGARIHYGHLPENVTGADVVVTSSAVRSSNVEVQEARRLRVPVIPRAEMLAELMRMKYGILISGSHGKTTATSMVGSVLYHCGFDPTIVIGGRVNALDSNARLGRGEFMVAEADESDGSFLRLAPTIAVVTNVDAEHLDHYRNLETLHGAFLEFANKVPFYGSAIVDLDDPGIRSILPRIERRVVTYGSSRSVDLLATNLTSRAFRTRFDVRFQGEILGTLSLQLPGGHNVHNALAAVAVGLELGIDFPKIADALAGFEGTDRRFQRIGEKDDIVFVDDYGHHPTEIMSTLKFTRQGFGRRVVAVFQPHRYSRVSDLFEEFCGAFEDSDLLVVTDIYPAGEEPIPDVTADALFEGIREKGHRNVILIRELKDVPSLLNEMLKSGDLVITLGAGDVSKVGREILALREE